MVLLTRYLIGCNTEVLSLHVVFGICYLFMKHYWLLDPEGIEKDIKRCIVDSFKKLDEDFLNEAKSK